MSGKTVHKCTISWCVGIVFREVFLLPTGEPDTMRSRELWECDTCGALWNLNGIPWKPVYYWNLNGIPWKPADFVVRES